MRWSTLLVLPAVAVGIAAPASATSAQDQWLNDNSNHGGKSSGVYNAETQMTLGDAICTDIKKGSAAANEVVGVSNDMHMTMSQAMVATYWAITDICPDQMSQRQDHWRDGS
jgi:hypothetical protein